MADHKETPPDFSIWHSRHGKKWCWRQNTQTDDALALGCDIERVGFRSRPAALADVHAELARREHLLMARAANSADADQRTTAATRGAP